MLIALLYFRFCCSVPTCVGVFKSETRIIFIMRSFCLHLLIIHVSFCRGNFSWEEDKCGNSDDRSRLLKDLEFYREMSSENLLQLFLKCWIVDKFLDWYFELLLLARISRSYKALQ